MTCRLFDLLTGTLIFMVLDKKECNAKVKGQDCILLAIFIIMRGPRLICDIWMCKHGNYAHNF